MNHITEVNYFANHNLHCLNLKLTKQSFKNISFCEHHPLLRIKSFRVLTEGNDTAVCRGSRCAELCFRVKLSSDHLLDIQYQGCRIMESDGFLCVLVKKTLMRTEEQPRKHFSLQLCQFCQQQSFLFTGSREEHSIC